MDDIDTKSTFRPLSDILKIVMCDILDKNIADNPKYNIRRTYIDEYYHVETGPRHLLKEQYDTEKED